MISFELDFVYTLIYMIIGYSLLNLTISLIANFRKKNTPGNNYIYMSILCSFGTIPLLFLYYPLALAAWFINIVLYCRGAEMNHEEKKDYIPLSYLFSMTIAAIVTFALLSLHP
jgi:hypothetical protein